MRRPTVVLDFDGTMVENAWPDIGDWMPGAIHNILKLQQRGYHCRLASARLTPVDFYTGEDLTPAYVMGELQKVRHTLEDAGLGFVEIWDKPGKAPGDIYIDDRGLYYPGRSKSWDKMFEVITARLEKHGRRKP